jgi:YggT family protein
VGSSPFVDAGQYLTSLLFGVYITIVAIRFLLQLVKADFYNPLSQFVVKATAMPLRLLRRFIPGYAGIDWPSITLMLGLQMLEIILMALLGPGGIPAFPGLIILSIAELLRLIIYIFTFAIIIQVIISWVSPGTYNPVTVVLYKLTEPLLRPARRYIPPMGGLDFSAIAVFIILRLITILFINPLAGFGVSLA